MERGAWQATVCGVAKSHMQLTGFHFSLSQAICLVVRLQGHIVVLFQFFK